jgi:ribosomal protein L21E
MLPLIALQLNTATKEGTSISAYDLVFGRLPRELQSAILPPRRTDWSQDSSFETLAVDIREVTRSIRDAWKTLRTAHYKRSEPQPIAPTVTFEPGDQVVVVYEPGATRTSKHFFGSQGPATVIARVGQDYDIKMNKTGLQKRVPWLVLHRFYTRSSSIGAGGDLATQQPYVQQQVSNQVNQQQPTAPTQHQDVVQGEQQAEVRVKQPRKRLAKVKTSRRIPQRKVERRKVNINGDYIPFSVADDFSSDDEGAPRSQPLQDSSGGTARTIEAGRTSTNTGTLARSNGTANPLDSSTLTGEFALVEDSQEGYRVGKILEVNAEAGQIHLRWYGPEQGKSADSAKWLPMWFSTTSGTSIMSTVSKRGYKPEEFETDLTKVKRSFNLTADDRLPQDILELINR